MQQIFLLLCFPPMLIQQPLCHRLLFASLMISLQNVHISIFMIIKMGKRIMMWWCILWIGNWCYWTYTFFILFSIWQRVDYELCHSTFCFTLWTKVFSKVHQKFSSFCIMPSLWNQSWKKRNILHKQQFALESWHTINALNQPKSLKLA